ncbi:MAG TPA: Gfo/Idh/MocA family oxidoreductase [Phycisphaerae bacterium]|nr:Gfo/Idh/MocA family oxidoreductase [Phycisphaerae bacterium]HRY68105.1 Gfo/Idh/MocA family oxidoreductase [Phycisphaerae bacterium]HSA28812.1 Gfo/Idh/MocA family oxidoreductase [Phycisphaerae bacterium]
MSKQSVSRLSRRQFVQTAAVAAAATSAFPHFARAADADLPIKVGLIGAGGRGTGAAHNVLAAAKGVQVVAVADIAKDRLENAKKDLRGKNQDIKDEHCFLGMDAYKKLLALDNVNYVILATPPYYRPEHLEASIKAGKHVFTEKPVAVDPVGIRRFIAAGKDAAAKKLSIVAGTQRRHQAGYVETIKRIHDGALGKIVAGQCYWNMGMLWYNKKAQGWSDMEWMHRDWVNWTWLSGDHIVEQHVHNLDVINWALKILPTKAVAMGSRHRRVTGDQYDNFSVDFFYPGDKEHPEIHVLSQCRQINGCANDVSERVIGTKGISNCNGWISNVGKIESQGKDPYVQEHTDLIAAIRQGEPINEAEQVAHSTMCAIMARMSAYTGKAVTWSDAMKSDLQLAPPEGPLTPEYVKSLIAVPGDEEK